MKTRCPGCGVELEAVEGPSDPYGVSSPACWAAFGEVSAREFSGPAHFGSHRLSVDAYLAQHPSSQSRAAIQSVWVHLAGLCLSLERQAPPKFVATVMGKLADHRVEYPPLDRPANLGAVTVAELAGCAPDAHAAIARRWAASVWEAWAPVHALVRARVDDAIR